MLAVLALVELAGAGAALLTVPVGGGGLAAGTAVLAVLALAGGGAVGPCAALPAALALSVLALAVLAGAGTTVQAVLALAVLALAATAMVAARLLAAALTAELSSCSARWASSRAWTSTQRAGSDTLSTWCPSTVHIGTFLSAFCAWEDNAQSQATHMLFCPSCLLRIPRCCQGRRRPAQVVGQHR